MKRFADHFTDLIRVSSSLWRRSGLKQIKEVKRNFLKIVLRKGELFIFFHKIFVIRKTFHTTKQLNPMV
ncbi:hypothetical protein [Leptospira interrogans]|uniref:hypothetical protein n=1 Tax=Leptospira interrogans TaxID=173 RepID=UPI0007730034|nr:hypothetical protein [Leptospira interrogans]MCR8639843.1 hypothetical protein [Leptospira interrogans serovar Ricardi]